jgi:phosphoglycerol transferase MdoB-like AlkP superfamily enzyme
LERPASIGYGELKAIPIMSQSFAQRLRELNAVHVSTVTVIAVVIQLAALASSWITHPSATGAGITDKLLQIVVCSLSTVLIFQLANLSLLRWPRIRACVTVGLFLIVGMLALYRTATAHALDYYLLADNAALLSFRESWSVLFSRLNVTQWGLLAIGAAGICLAAIRTNLLTAWPKPRYYVATLSLTIVVLAAVILSPLYRATDSLYVVRTAFDYYFQAPISDIDASAQFPYVKRATKPSAPDGPRPHIFIIMMESFNANFVERKTRDGREYTPVFNSLIPQGIYPERYYGNGIQTAPGQLAMLCSILPSVRGKVFTDRPNLRLRSLPTILKEHGYNTLFFKGYKSLDFDNTGEFMRHIDFDEVHAMDASFITDDDKPFIWGWGLQDDRTYQKVFAFMDKRPPAQLDRTDFVVIHTVSHHMPFDHLPKEKWFLFPDASSPQEHFANSTYLADQFLTEFFKQLTDRERYKDSIVIITGDHSFPAGEHGNFHNETGFYEENFRTPFVLVWQGAITPKRLDEGCYSHLDLAPTILGLLQINTNHHFLGRSLMESPVPDRPIHLIQPYNGTFLAVVQYPFKYVRGLRAPGEYLFNLAEDPNERRNVLDEVDDVTLRTLLKAELGRIRLNQRLIDQDRVWQANITAHTDS